MKLKNLFAAAFVFASLTTNAQDCVIPINVHLDEDFTNVPSAATKVLYQSLNRAATENGLTTEANTQFILTAYCDVLDKSNLPGPPIQTVYNLGLTLYVADSFTHKKFATAYITLNGVGTGEVKSYINAFGGIKANNIAIKDLINKGKSKILEYYDTQYAKILAEAKRLESVKNYEEALALAFSIPVCSKGGDDALEYGVQLYSKYINRLNMYLLNQAKTLWAAGQNQQTAFDACAILAQIDPDSDCYAEAGALMKEIKKQVRSDIDFEMREKYRDQIQLEKDRIAAARAVGVAFGNGQKPTTTNLMWLK